MKIFPTQYSLLSAAALKDALEELYGFNSMTCRLLIHNVSDTYILEKPSAQYIFKIYREAHRTLEEIRGEVELLNILREQGASIAYPIKDIKGNQIQSFNAAEGIRHGVLFKYAQGKVYQIMSDGQLATVGREMARIHRITSEVTLKYERKEFNLNTMLTLPLEKLRPAFENLTAEYIYLQETNKKVISWLEQLDLSKFGYGYCHYDFLPKNFHFQDNGNITFFDFDFAGKGHFANDLASFYAHFFLQVMFKASTQDEADRSFNVFIENYRSIRALTDVEIEAIPYFGYCWWVFYLGFQYENFEDWSNFFFSPKFIKERIGLIKTWVNWYITSKAQL
jgi:Ser/Thr protein kinase RdoA (MazF antagonist)